MHEWMVDNGLTPHIVVDASSPNLNVPPENIKDDKVVLNVSYAATRGLVLGNDTVAFEARFSGVPRAINVPVEFVLGIYARESGQGMVFRPRLSISPAMRGWCSPKRLGRLPTTPVPAPQKRNGLSSRS